MDSQKQAALDIATNAIAVAVNVLELGTFTAEEPAMTAARGYLAGTWAPQPKAKHPGITYVTLDDEPKGGAQ